MSFLRKLFFGVILRRFFPFPNKEPYKLYFLDTIKPAYIMQALMYGAPTRT